jgi:hypothetical protein
MSEDAKTCDVCGGEMTQFYKWQLFPTGNTETYWRCFECEQQEAISLLEETFEIIEGCGHSVG